MFMIYIVKDCDTNNIEAIFSTKEKVNNYISIIDPNNEWTIVETHIVNKILT